MGLFVARIESLSSPDMQTKYKLLFDLFAQHKDVIKQEQIKEIVQLFGNETSLAELDKRKPSKLSLKDFIGLVQDLDLQVMRELETVIFVEMGLVPADHKREREIISAMMDLNYKKYLRT